VVLLPEAQQHTEERALTREFMLPGDLDSVAPARDAIVEFIREYCTDEQQEIDVFLALQEALANATLHGCQNDSSKLVRCTVEITPSAMTFDIRDPGPGFETESAADEAEDGTNLTEHGRGIYLMRSLMDQVSYRQRGSEVLMKKLRTLSR
jgi:serine/threonine-protein kinase RsbW